MATIEIGPVDRVATGGSLLRRLSIAVVAVTAFTYSHGAQAKVACPADFPSKPIRFVVGFAAGGGTDVIGRWDINIGSKTGERADIIGKRTLTNAASEHGGGGIASADRPEHVPEGPCEQGWFECSRQ